MKKNICIIAYYFPPENNGGTERVRQFYKWLKNDKYDVYVLTKKTKLKNVYKNDNHVIRLQFFWLFLRVYEGLLRKYGYNFGIFLKLSEFCLKVSFRSIAIDICIASYPPVYDLYAGIMFKKNGVNLIVDFRDGLMYAPFSYIVNANETYKNEMKNLEKNILSIADFTIAATPQLTEYIKDKYCSKVFTVPNGFDDTEEIDVEPINLGDNFNVVYTGRIDLSRVGVFEYVKQGIGNLFTENATIVFHFVGDYTDDEKRLFSKYSNVKVHAKVERNVAIATQRCADILLLITTDDVSGTSGKLYEYLFTDVPILNIGYENNACDIIKKANAGVSFRPDQINDINNFLYEVKRNKMKQVFERKKDVLEQYTRKIECNYLMNLIEKMLNNSKNINES